MGIINFVTDFFAVNILITCCRLTGYFKVVCCVTIIGCNFIFNDLLHQTFASFVEMRL